MREKHASRPAKGAREPSLVVCSVFLLLAVAAVYGQTAGFEFVNYDDREYVLENPHVLSGLTPEGFAWAFTTTHQANWHPLTWISLMLDSAVFGVRPGAFHLVNVLLHAANTLLLFLSLDRLTRARWKSAFVAALFAVHPLHVESVAWVAERKDVLSTFFGLLALLAYATWAKRPGRGRYALCVFWFFLSLLAKPMLVTLPFLLLLLDVWPLGRIPLGEGGARVAWRRIHEKTPLFLLAAASSVVTVVAQRAGGALASLEVYPLHVRIENALIAYVAYLGKAFWPVRLAVPYPHPHEAVSLHAAIACGILLACVTIAVLAGVRSRPWLAVSWLFYLGALVPVIGIVQVGLQAMADRYTYLPLVGVFLLVAWGVPDVVDRFGIPSPARRGVLLGGGGAVVLALAVVAARQASLWHDSVSLFEHTIRITRNNDTAENNLGSAYYALGRMEEAVAHYSAAVDIQPRYSVALNNLAGALNRLGRVDEAIARWNQAILYKPDFSDARANLGGTLYQLGRVDEAIEQCEQALRFDPVHGAAHYNLGIIKLRQGRLDEAYTHLAAAVRASPEDENFRQNLGVALAKQGRLEEAIAQFQQILKVDPGNESARRNLELARSRGGKEL